MRSVYRIDNVFRCATLARILLGFGALVCCGCDREPPIYRVHGTVTVDGQKIPAGMIYFDPAISRTALGVQGFAYVKDGQFDTADEGRGVSGGAYVARIQGFDGQPAVEQPLGEALFAEQKIEIVFPQAETRHDFQLAPDKAEQAEK